MFRLTNKLFRSVIVSALIFSAFLCGCSTEAENSSSATVAASAETTETTKSESSATDDEASAEIKWNYTELKRHSDEVSENFDSLITKYKFRGTVYVKIGTALEYIGDNGFSDKSKHTKNSANTRFRIGSLTKQFTAAAVMQLKEKDMLSLDDTIDKYFSSYKHGSEITVKNLLTMTAGLRDYINADGDTGTPAYNESELEYSVSADNSEKENKKAIMDWIFSKELNFTPGEQFMYSNSAYFLLGDIIEQVSGMTYEDYITENILKPLAMNNTGFDSDDSLATGYQDIYDNEWTLYPGVAYSAAGLISNVSDLLKWTEGLCGGQVVSAGSFDEMTTPYKNNYGYGFYISQTTGAVSHIGKLDKYNSSIVFSKDGSNIFIALSNYSNSDPSNLFMYFKKELSSYIS